MSTPPVPEQATGGPGRLARLARAGVLVTAGTALLALAGWGTSWLGLARGVPGSVPMAPSTALLFLALAGALLVEGRWSRPARLVVGVVIAALGAEHFFSFLAGQTARLDRLLVPELVAAPAVSEGRMAPMTAVAFLLAGGGTALLGLGHRWRRAGDVAGALGALVTALGLLVSFTFVYDTSPFGGPATMPVAATTAVAFVGLGLALVALDGATRFPARLLSGPSHSARLGRSFLPLVPLVVLAHAAFHQVVPDFQDALRDALLSLLLLAVVLLGVLWAAAEAGRFLERAEADRRRAEASEGRFAVLFKHSPLAVVITSIEGRILAANERAAGLFGYPADDVMGRSVTDLDLWHDPAQRGRLLARLAAGEELDGVAIRFRHADGSARDVLISGAAVPVEGGPPLIMAAFVDVTERKQLEARLMRAQNLEVVGRLAGGIAHDYNNLLGVVLGHAERLERSGDPEVARRAAGIARAGERAADLTRQLLAFSRRQVLAPEPLDLNALVTDVEALLRSLVGERMQVELRRSASMAPVLADRRQLQQVLIDLCANAREAMPEGGRLTIEIASIEAADPAWPVAVEGPQVLLRVEDDGPGMEAAELAHVFEPFYSTREAGAGLGLATVYGIVQQSGGQVRIDSAPGRGTRVEILLPRSTAAPVPAAAPAPARSRVAATVLLAEDEDALRELTEEVLTEAGYEVLAAPDAARALELAAAHSGPIDLLLTDVVMPGADGAELAARLRESRPEVRVLFVSGYSEDVVSEAGRLDPGVALLAKPFTTSDLLQHVAQALAPPPA
ncbi:MAG: PAS domain S-box protein [Vicinamibacteria bacterium]|nr:PAS domain S-box protein [Vicinamibacteria bacterium]